MTADQVLAAVTSASTVGAFIAWARSSLRHRKLERAQELMEAKRAGEAEGEARARGDAQRAATEKLHMRMDQYRDRIARLEGKYQRQRELLIEARIGVPEDSQVGTDGRGVPNPWSPDDDR